jgi:hypothetical protein
VALWWLGIVVIVSAKGTVDRGFKSRREFGFRELNIAVLFSVTQFALFLYAFDGN